MRSDTRVDAIDGSCILNPKRIIQTIQDIGNEK